METIKGLSSESGGYFEGFLLVASVQVRERKDEKKLSFSSVNIDF